MLTDKFISEILAKTNPIQARISAFEQVRNIPYSLVPGESTAEQMLERGTGDCRAKTELLCRVFKALGLLSRPTKVKYLLPDFPDEVAFIPNKTDYHHTCEVFLGDRWVLVDATYDPPLKAAGFTVNEWDGLTATSCCVAAVSYEFENPLEFDREFEQFLALLGTAARQHSRELKEYTRKFNEIVLKARQTDSN